MISKKNINFYKKYGYLKLKNFINSNEINSCLKSALYIKKKSINGINKYTEKRIDGLNRSILIRAENFYKKNNNLSKIIENKHILTVLERLFNNKPLLFKEKINYKPPGSRADMLHQDSQAGWNKYCKRFISVLIPLEKSTLNNGCLQFDISGNNHKRLASKAMRPLELNELVAPKFKYFKLNPGDIIFFNNYIPHKSDPNLGKKSRIQLYLTYNNSADGDFRKKYISKKLKNYPPNNQRKKNIIYKYKI
jgi:ectoine hydroxylase-related dioxygenase (phytanoyl-CoA dioxygenase family)